MFRWGVGQANQYSVTTSSERTSWTPPGGPTETTPIASVMLTGSVQVMPCDGFRRVPSQDRPTSFSLLAMVCVQHICTFAIKSKSYISIKKRLKHCTHLEDSFLSTVDVPLCNAGNCLMHRQARVPCLWSSFAMSRQIDGYKAKSPSPFFGRR